MRITAVALENIKSYQKIEVPLRSGTTAIRGHNGAGKSTLVEAIGFALFDAINYSQDQFVREGERYGVVTVSFISAEDDREYQAVRRCGSSPTWYIYDPELQMRVVEQKTDVTDFLRRHLRLETDISLRDLFNDALGIPQGTFTADFLLAPASRKKKFDTLLQIEDYRKAAEKLNDTRAYLQEERRNVEKRIAELEHETNQLEGWRASLAALREQQQAISTRLLYLETASAEAEKRRDALREQYRQIQNLEGKVKLAEAASNAAEAQQNAALRLLAEARLAAESRDAATSDYQRYLAATDKSNSANQRVLLRDQLARKRSEIAERHVAADRDLRNVEERLREAYQAEEKLRDVTPLVERQKALEGKRDAARMEVERGEEIVRQLERDRRSGQRNSQDIQTCEKAITALESLGPEADMLDQRREHLAMLQDLRARQSEREKRLEKILQEQRDLVAIREKATGNQSRLSENVRKIRANQSVAEELPTLEDRCRDIEGQLRLIEARRDQHRRSSEASVGGNCPFLQEPCLNIQRKGVRSLSNYFDQQVAQEEVALQGVRNQLVGLEQQRDRAREVRKYFDKLELYEQQLASVTEQRTAAEKRLAELAAEQREIEDFERASPNSADLAEAQKLFKKSDDADKKLRELEPRRTELARLQAQQADLMVEATRLEKDLAKVEPVKAVLTQIENELSTLGDQRLIHAHLQHLADGRPAYQAEVNTRERQLQSLVENLAKLEHELAPFAQLESEIAVLRHELEESQPGYQQYLRYEKLAEQLPGREEDAKKASVAARSAEVAFRQAQSAHRECCSMFDEEALKRAEQSTSDLKDEDMKKRAELHYLLKESQQVEAQISRAEAMQIQLNAERTEVGTLEDLEQMLAHFRDIIKEAGPFIMKALLREISIQANRIFGEIMGDHSAELAWTNEYEIVLGKNGQERSFAQLSGGEQMSAALAVRLALLRHLSRLDIAFFDEPTQNMDGERRGNLAEQIRRVRGFDQLIVISHDDTFEQGLDSVIHLEKLDGKTVLVDDDMLIPA